jgi:short-subunit dehydrogenase
MKIIVITGASDGIGAEIARQLAAANKAQVGLVLAARNVDALNAVAAQCNALGAQTLVVKTDVGVQADCVNLIAQAAAKFGRIDALINNAGISAQALFEDVKTQDLGWCEDVMRVNLWGSVWCTHAALAGLIGVPGRTAYSASKFAMTGFFEALRAELKGAGVSVTTAYPGVVTTNIRHRGLNAAGVAAGSSGLKEDDAMSVETCAGLIITGMQRRQREVVMTGKGKLGRFLKLIAPGMVEKMALAALKDDVKPKS